MTDFADHWKCVEDKCIQVDLWIATPKEGTPEHVAMMKILGDYVDNAGLCVTATRTFFRYTGGTELGLKIGLRNYPRFPVDWQRLISHAETIGRLMAEAGDQGSYMIEDGSTVYWFTRRTTDHGEEHQWLA